VRRSGLLVPVLLLAIAPAASGGAQQQVVLGNIPCKAPAEAPLFDTSACNGIKPGALVYFNDGQTLCTLGFLVKGSDGRRYAMTAGHCVTDVETESTYKGDTGPAMQDPDENVVGHVAYVRYDELADGTRSDFALIRLAKGVQADAQVCTFGGPTAINTDVDDTEHVISHVGQAIVVGDLLPARTGLITRGLHRPDYVYAHALSVDGDSGGPVLDSSGKAIGLITQLTAGPNGSIGINRIGPHLDRAAKLMKTKLKLETASTL
jgi:hypothetical protein